MEAQALNADAPQEFQRINRGYNTTFRLNRLSLGLVVPIEAHGSNPVPEMDRHLERILLAEELGFAAVWLRDVPFNVPSFGDAGQTYDPFAYLGYLAGRTDHIALGVASAILPLRHPAHVAKAASTVDVLSDGRLILGIASGDRPDEYPALNQDFCEPWGAFPGKRRLHPTGLGRLSRVREFVWIPRVWHGHAAETGHRTGAASDHGQQSAGPRLDCPERRRMDDISPECGGPGACDRRVEIAGRRCWRSTETSHAVPLCRPGR